MQPMMAPPPMQFAPMAMPPPDASGHAAIGGLANLALALQGRMGQPGATAGPTDAPMRKKVPFGQAAANSQFA